MDARKPTSPRRLRARELERKVLEMRMTGARFSAIAEACGCSTQGAHMALTRALSSIVALNNQTAKELFILEIARLDELQAAIWDKAIAGDPESIDQALRIILARAKVVSWATEKSVQDETSTPIVISWEDEIHALPMGETGEGAASI